MSAGGAAKLAGRKNSDAEVTVLAWLEPDRTPAERTLLDL